MGFRINILSVGRSNGIDDNGRIGPGRLLDSRAYPVFDPGGHARRRGTRHDGLGSVGRGHIGGWAEFGAARVGRCAIVIAVLVEAGMPEAVVRRVGPGCGRGQGARRAIARCLGEGESAEGMHQCLFLHRYGIPVAGVGGNHQVLAAGKERVDGEKSAQGHRRGRSIDGRYRSAIIRGAIHGFNAGDRKRQTLRHDRLYRHGRVDRNKNVSRAFECAANRDGVDARCRRIRDPVTALLAYRRVRSNVYSYLR